LDCGLSQWQRQAWLCIRMHSFSHKGLLLLANHQLDG